MARLGMNVAAPFQGILYWEEHIFIALFMVLKNFEHI